MVNKVQPYEKLVDFVVSNPQKGMTIPHTEVEKTMGIPYKTDNYFNKQYSYQVSKANEKLTQKSLRLEPIKGFGYRIINDNQYVDSMRKAYNAGVRSIKKARTIAHSTIVGNLSEEEYKEWREVSKKIKSAYLSMEIIPTSKTKKLQEENINGTSK